MTVYKNGDVECPACEGSGCNLCQGHGHVTQIAAMFYCETFPTCDDVTPEEIARIRAYAWEHYRQHV